LRRGDLVIVSAPGGYGKPRPAVIIQSDQLVGTDSVLVALITSAMVDAPIFRLTIDPSAQNGLKVPSQVMVDKIVALPRAKCGEVIGQLMASEITALNALLAVTVGLADGSGR
jgi:mRNA interferase MazF